MIRRLSGGGQSGRANGAKELERLLDDPVEKPWVEKERRSSSRRAAIDADRRAGGKPHTVTTKTLFRRRFRLTAASACDDRPQRCEVDDAADAAEEKPRAGTAMMGDSAQCKVNYFYQNQAEGLDTEKGVLQTLVEAAPDGGLNDLKPSAGSSARASTTNPSSSCQAGGRLALAVMVTPANVLLLDEPTNHLDIPSKEMLEEALQSFEGTVTAISHDRYFLRQIATRVLNFDNGVVSDYMGDYSYFLEKNEKAGARDASCRRRPRRLRRRRSRPSPRYMEKAKLKKEKAKAFGGGSGQKKANKNAGRWNKGRSRRERRHFIAGVPGL